MSSFSSIPAFSPPPYSSPSNSPRCELDQIEGRQGDELVSIERGFVDIIKRSESLDEWIAYHRRNSWVSYPIKSTTHLEKLLKRKKIRIHQKRQERSLRKGRPEEVIFNKQRSVYSRIPQLTPDHIQMLNQWMEACSDAKMEFGWQFEINEARCTFQANFPGKGLLLDALKTIAQELKVPHFCIMLAYDEKNIEEGMGIDQFLGRLLDKYEWIPIYKLNRIRDRYLRIRGSSLETQQESPIFFCDKLKHNTRGKLYMAYVLTSIHKFTDTQPGDEECSFSPYPSNGKMECLLLDQDVFFLYIKKIESYFKNYNHSFCIEDMSQEQQDFFGISDEETIS